MCSSMLLHKFLSSTLHTANRYRDQRRRQVQARNQDFMWGGANEAKADPATEMYFLSSDPFI